MKGLLVFGVILIVLGIASLFITIPHKQTSGVRIGGAEIGVQTQTSERFPLPASIAVIVGGVVLTAVGARSRS
ncbi:MAG: hypothetical protein ACR2IF_18015 [Terriglobales bacterium]